MSFLCQKNWEKYSWNFSNTPLCIFVCLYDTKCHNKVVSRKKDIFLNHFLILTVTPILTRHTKLSVILLSSTSEMFLSVSFLLSSIFLSMPTIPTARVLPACKTTKERKTQTETQVISKSIASLKRKERQTWKGKENAVNSCYHISFNLSWFVFTVSKKLWFKTLLLRDIIQELWL